MQDQVTVVTGDTFRWAEESLPVGDSPWIVFCSPPYDFYVEKCDDMMALLNKMINAAPADSCFVIESDGRFNVESLPEEIAWAVRRYPPAVVAVGRLAQRV